MRKLKKKTIGTTILFRFVGKFRKMIRHDQIMDCTTEVILLGEGGKELFYSP
jgi:hypothetical protein